MLDIDAAYAHLLALSQNSLGKTAPNPNVSALIYSANGELIAEGAHDRTLSNDHAEVVAIKSAGDRTQGSTIVISLEPCNHIGATGPCVDAIIAAGITRVIYAMKDPNPVASGGAERLAAAGVTVEFIANAELAEIQGAWLHRIANGRPYFIWKVAATLDGRIAASDGTSQWISSPESRSDVQRLRAESDAILIGTGTALADNPTLRPRLDGAANPLRIVVGEREVPADFNLNDGDSETLFVKNRDLTEVVATLSKLPLNQVLVEAGSTLGSALVKAGFIDELVLYQAPVVLGAGKTWLDDIGISTIEESKKLALISHEQSGPDMKFRYRVENR